MATKKTPKKAPAAAKAKTAPATKASAPSKSLQSVKKDALQAPKTVAEKPALKQSKDAKVLSTNVMPTKSSNGAAPLAPAAGVMNPKPNSAVAGTLITKSTPVGTEKSLKENLAKRPAASLESSMRIFQIYYEPWQRELLDPNFIPLDNSKDRSELLEFSVFERLAQSNYVKGASLWGALSWRFTEKTGMSGDDWVKNITSHPGFDVYYCDPNPQNEALFHNLWMQGETSHPQFLAICQAVFQVVGLPTEELISILPSEHYSSTNCFVATPKFWANYLNWVKNVLTLANKKLPPKVRDLLHSTNADDRGLHKGSTYIPFIVERLFPVFMKTAGKGMKGYKVALPEREKELNVHLKLLREMKDLSHKTNSAWLAACWVNYRNLYLTQVQKKDWCAQYLTALNPKEIKFS
jgi:hypothetical protein